jgi:membrane protein
MRLLPRHRQHERTEYYDERPLPDEAPAPQPERSAPRLEESTPSDPSGRDYVGIVKRAAKKFNRDHMTSMAAALAYYAFLAIPSALLLAVGVFSVVASPQAITTLIDKLHGIMSGQATSLIEGSLRNMMQHQGTGISVIVVGGVLAVWSLTGAMQNVMWAANAAYDRKETRGFVRRRVIALFMVVFALLGSLLAFGVLVLGPQLSTWLGKSLGAESEVKIGWYVAEWPLLLAGFLVAFAGLMLLAPDVKQPRWQFLSLGAVTAIVIWLVASGAFAFYVGRFGSYNKTWGSLAAVVILLTWLWLTALAVLLGAEVNAESERGRGGSGGSQAEAEA